MERTLHRQLKARYGSEAGGRNEVKVGAFRVDAIGADGCLIEIQSGPLGLLKPKLLSLLPDRRFAVVKPVVVQRRVVKRSATTGLDLGSRRSPWRGSLLDTFEELVGLAPLLPDPNLTIELLAVDVDEIRVDRRRRPGYLVVDRVLREVVVSVILAVPDDLWTLLPADLPEPFTSIELAKWLDRPLPFARKIAYCLRVSGAARVVAKLGNQRVYERARVEELALV